MKTREYLYMFFILSFLAGCESLEDTYSDYAGDGTIRYLGKCEGLSVAPGWKRLVATWKNHPDPVIDKIKLSWMLDGMTRDTLLEATATRCVIQDLKNGTYEISVCSVDKDGNCSLPVMAYTRPYTEEHEQVVSFARVVNKHFFVKDRLVLFFDAWQTGVNTARVNYYSGGKVKHLELDSVFVTDNACFLLPDALDPGKGVTIERAGRLQGCPDLIDFVPLELTPSKVYTPDFKYLLRVKYGLQDIDESFINTIETLEIDHDITSFEDILNLPNLKTLFLGKNRFMHPSYLSGTESEVSERERSLFAMSVMNEVRGCKIQRYNNHYFPGESFPYVEEMGNPELPETGGIFATGEWTYSCSCPDETVREEATEKLPALFDGDMESGWQPRYHNSPQTYEIVVDMQETKLVRGARISQLNATNSSYARCMARKIQVKISGDSYSWQDACNVPESTLGHGKLETTILHFPGAKKGRYLKFILSDQAYNTVMYSISLGDISVF